MEALILAERRDGEDLGQRHLQIEASGAPIQVLWAMLFFEGKMHNTFERTYYDTTFCCRRCRVVRYAVGYLCG